MAEDPKLPLLGKNQKTAATSKQKSAKNHSQWGSKPTQRHVNGTAENLYFVSKVNLPIQEHRPRQSK